MYFRNLLFTAVFLFLTFPDPGLANEEITQYRPHERGAARLLVTTHNDSLEIMLESPAINLFDFEHLPTTDNEHKKVHDVTELLESADGLFDTGDAQCHLENVAMDSAQILAHELVKHADTEADKDFSEHEQSSLLTAPENETEHNNIDIIWIFTCANPDKLDQLSLKLFTAFSGGFSHLDVEWDTEKGAGTLEFSRDGILFFAP